MELTIAITTYNRFELTTKSIANILEDERVREIIINDDCSTDGSYEKLQEFYLNFPKVSLFRNAENLGMQLNKVAAIGLVETEWVAILDSDNVFDSSYLDAFFAVQKHYPDTIYAPSWARPTFDYRDFEGMVINKRNVGELVGKPFFGALINTCNYVVNKEYYLKTFKPDKSILGVDTANHFLNHIKAGGSFLVVPNMHYDHLVHSGSEFMKEVHYNMQCAIEIENKLKNL